MFYCVCETKYPENKKLLCLRPAAAEFQDSQRANPNIRRTQAIDYY